MAKFKEKIEAEALRRKGLSLKVIAKRLGVSRSSVSMWCRDIELTLVQKEKLNQNHIEGARRGVVVAAENRRRERVEQAQASKEEATSFLGRLSLREFHLIGIALYWAEGAKKNKFAFVNSDPKMILLIYHWLQQCMGVKSDDLILTISINEMHRPRIDIVQEFWKNLLGVPSDQFRKHSFIKTPHKKVYKNHETYYGILSIRVRRCIRMHRKIIAQIGYLQDYNYAGVAQWLERTFHKR